MEEQMTKMVERLSAAAAALEQVTARLEVQASAGEGVGKIVATVASVREEELERRLAESETKVAELQAAGAGRKTAGVGRMVAKGGAASEGALDAALQSLTVEQRIAVKAELMRAGIV